QAAVDDAAARVQQVESRLASARSAAAEFAERLYMYADQTSGLAATLAGAATAEGAAQRGGGGHRALGEASTAPADLKALTEDVQTERTQLAQREADKAKAVTVVAARKKAAETAQAQQQQQLTKVKGELATLVVQEQQRRQQAANQLAAQQVPLVDASL